MAIKYVYKNQGELIPFEAGEHNIKIKSASAGFSTKGHDVLTLWLEGEEGQSIKDELHFTDSAGWRIETCLKATKLSEGMEAGHQIDIVPEAFVGRKARVLIGEETYTKDGEKKTIMKVKRWIAQKDVVNKPTASADKLNY